MKEKNCSMGSDTPQNVIQKVTDSLEIYSEGYQTPQKFIQGVKYGISRKLVIRGLWRACNLTAFIHSLTGPVGQPFASCYEGPGFNPQGGTYVKPGFSC